MTYIPYSAVQIRDETFERLRDIKGVRNVFKAHLLPIQDNYEDSQLPAIRVVILGEDMDKWGESNIGAPGFAHTLRMGVGVLVKAPDENTLDYDVWLIVESIRQRLFRDATWVKLFEGFEHSALELVYPGESGGYVVEARINITVKFHSLWEPIVTNTLDGVTVVDNPRNANVSSTMEVDLKDENCGPQYSPKRYY